MLKYQKLWKKIKKLDQLFMTLKFKVLLSYNWKNVQKERMKICKENFKKKNSKQKQNRKSKIYRGKNQMKWEEVILEKIQNKCFPNLQDL